MIDIENLNYRIGERIIFEEASAVISKGQKIGFVGLNGSGKTTLFNLILGKISLDSGEIRKNSNLKIVTQEQEIEDTEQKLIDFVLSKDKELTELNNSLKTEQDPLKLSEIYEKLNAIQASSAPARAGKILDGLGFTFEDQSKKLSEFSGGWRVRASLAGTLFQRADLLLLDEPTNHLDLETSIWFTNFMKKNPTTTVIISHDKDILNSICNRIISIENLKLESYGGNYNSYIKNRALKNWVLHSLNNIPKVKISEYENVFKSSSLSESEIMEINDLISKFNINSFVIGGVDESERLLEVKFISSENPYYEGGMGFYIHNSLFIPLNGGNDFYKLLRVCLLGSMSFVDKLQKENLNLLLEDALINAHDLVESPNSTLSSKEHGYNLICYANSCFKKGLLDKRGFKYINEAITVYSLSLPLLQDTDARMIAFVNHQLGCLNNFLASKSGDVKGYRKAMEFFDEALKSTPQKIEPLLWANLNFRLGELYFKLAIIENKEDDFFNAIKSFNESSTVYTQEYDEMKWAEIMNFMARVFLIHGEEYRNYEEVERAIDLSNMALSVRDKDVYPVLWANSKSIFASGIFLYGRYKKDKAMVYDAKKAFFDVKEVYIKAGIHSGAVNSDKNIHKIEEHLIEMQKDEEFLESKRVKTIFDGLDVVSDRDEGYDKGDKRDIGKY